MNRDRLPDRINARLRWIIFFLFLPVAGWTVFIVYWSGFDKYALWFLPPALLVTGALIAGRGRIRSLIFRLSAKKCMAAGAALAVVGFAGMLVIAFACRNRIENNWDYGMVFGTAADMTAKKVPIPSYARSYFAMYGNNTLFLRLLLLLLKGIAALTGRSETLFLLDCSIVVNCVLVMASILAASAGLSRLRSVQQGLITEVLLLLMSPFYLYAAFTYTDVYGLLPAGFVLFFMAKAFLKRDALRTDLFLAGAGAAAAFGYLMKGTVVIYVLAALLVILTAKEFSGRRLRHLAVYLCTAALVVFVLTVTNHSFLRKNGISDAYRKEQEFPPAHFLMMAMNTESAGQYNAEDVAYTQSYPGTKAKKEADLRRLKERLDQMGAGKTLYHIFVRKAKYIYGTGTAGAPSYIVRAPLGTSKLLEFVSRSQGFFEAVLLYKAVLEGFVLVMTLLTLIRRREEDGYVLFLKICWIGMFLFFGIWESHPRYTFVFLPLLGILAAEYLMEQRASCEERSGKKLLKTGKRD